MSEARARRLGERIHEIVAQALKFKVKDPRVGFVTITDVRVTADLRDATVFYTVYGDDAERTDTARALESATGLLRSEVGRETGIKFTPTLAFVPDAVPDTARHIEELLQDATARDSEIAAQAAQASYAGDADPYRHPEDEEDADAPESAGGEQAVDNAAETSGSEHAAGPDHATGDGDQGPR